MKCCSDEDFERLRQIQEGLYLKRQNAIAILDDITKDANEIGKIRSDMITCPTVTTQNLDHAASVESFKLKQTFEGYDHCLDYIKTTGESYLVEIDKVDSSGNYVPDQTQLDVNIGSANYIGTDGVTDKYTYQSIKSNDNEVTTFTWGDNCVKVFDETPWVPDATNGPIINLSDFMQTGVQGQTLAFVTALQSAAGGRLVIPTGEWWVTTQFLGTLNIPANTTVELQCGAVVRQEKTQDHASEVIFVMSQPNTHIRGLGTIRGELSLQTPAEGKLGENTFGVWVQGAASDWTIIGPTITELWGDGILIGASGRGIPFGGFIDCVDCNDNRRQGISVVWSDGLNIGRNTICRNTGQLAKQLGFTRQLPTAGIDCEQEPWSYVDNLVIDDMLSINNIGVGYVAQSPWVIGAMSVTFNGSIAIRNGDVSGDTYNNGFSQRRGFEFKEGPQVVMNQPISKENASDGISVDDLFLPTTPPAPWVPGHHSDITINQAIVENNQGCAVWVDTENTNPFGVTINSIAGFSSNTGGGYCKIGGSADTVNP